MKQFKVWVGQFATHNIKLFFEIEDLGCLLKFQTLRRQHCNWNPDLIWSNSKYELDNVQLTMSNPCLYLKIWVACLNFKLWEDSIAIETLICSKAIQSMSWTVCNSQLQILVCNWRFELLLCISTFEKTALQLKLWFAMKQSRVWLGQFAAHNMKSLCVIEVLGCLFNPQILRR